MPGSSSVVLLCLLYSVTVGALTRELFLAVGAPGVPQVVAAPLERAQEAFLERFQETFLQRFQRRSAKETPRPRQATATGRCSPSLGKTLVVSHPTRALAMARRRTFYVWRSPLLTAEYFVPEDQGSSQLLSMAVTNVQQRFAECSKGSLRRVCAKTTGRTRSLCEEVIARCCC